MRNKKVRLSREQGLNNHAPLVSVTHQAVEEELKREAPLPGPTLLKLPGEGEGGEDEQVEGIPQLPLLSPALPGHHVGAGGEPQG